MTEEITSPSLFRVASFVERHRGRGLTEPALRDHIHRSADNGLDSYGAIVRVGRTVWIDEDRYFMWLRSGRARSIPRSQKVRKHRRAAVIA